MLGTITGRIIAVPADARNQPCRTSPYQLPSDHLPSITIKRSMAQSRPGGAEAVSSLLGDSPEIAAQAAREIADAALAAVAKEAQRWEFSSFLLCTGLPDPQVARDDPRAHAFRRTLHTLVGTALEARWQGERTVDFKHAQVRFRFEVASGQVTATATSVYLYGRYCKLIRTLPQTHWDCRTCRGRGHHRRSPGTPCASCNGTGKQFPSSVEELIAAPLLPLFEAKSAVLHGMGREDIGARMLGTGRPFVLELRQPRHRQVAAPRMEEALTSAVAGKLAVPGGVHLVPGQARQQVKLARPDKSYTARLRVSRKPNHTDLARIDALSGATLAQRTPLRVAHRRSDLVRKRRIIAMQARLDPTDTSRIEIAVTAEAGTYIKELISGDNGRTKPSIAAALGTPCHCEELDVTDVHFDDKLIIPAR